MSTNLIKVLLELGNSTELAQNTEIIDRYLETIFPGSQFKHYIDSSKINQTETDTYTLISRQQGHIYSPTKIDKTAAAIKELQNQPHTFICLDENHRKSLNIGVSSGLSCYVIPSNQNGFILAFINNRHKLNETTFQDIRPLLHKAGNVIDNCVRYRNMETVLDIFKSNCNTHEQLTSEYSMELTNQVINTVSSMGDSLLLLDKNLKVILVLPSQREPLEIDVIKEAKRLILHASQILKYSSQPISYDIVTKRGRWFNLTITRRSHLDGTYDGIIVHSRDITQKAEAQEDIRISSSVDEIISNTSTRFIDIPVSKIESEINHVLEQIGYYLASDLAFVYLDRGKNEIMQLYQSWSRKLKRNNCNIPEQISLAHMKYLSKKIGKGEEFALDTIDDSSQKYSHEIGFLKTLNVLSLVIAPIEVEKKIAGFLGFATTMKNKEWNKHQIRLVKLLGKIFANTINRKNKQELLDIANSKLKTVIQNLNSGILLENGQNIIEHTNQRFCDLFNIKMRPSTIVGLENFVVNQFVAATQTNYENYLHNVKQYKEDLKINANEELYLTNGKIFEQDYTPIFYNNTLEGHLWQYRDITEKKKSERIIRENELRLKYAIEASNEAIWELTTPECEIYLSPKWYEIAKISPDTIMTLKDFIAIIVKEHQKAVETKFTDIKTGKINRFEIEYRITSQAKSDTWILMQGKATDRSELTTKVVGTITDITERKKLQQLLIDQRAKAEEATEAKSRFLANISHEIRNPMHGVLGLTELLIGTNPTSEQLRYLEAIKTSSKNMLAILNDLLDMSKISAGKITTSKVGFELSNIVSTLYYTLYNQAKSRNNEIKLDIDNEIAPVLKGDPVRINQILLNLINNALKFTESGQVTCKITCKKNLKTAQLIRFAIYDNGIGIKKEEINNVFEQYNQGSIDKKRKYEGTGLGLSISKQLVELLGGHMYVISKPNQGSVFWFNLLLNIGKPQDLRRNERKNSPTPVPSDKKILVAEDEPTNILIIQTALKNMGNNPVIATNGAKVIKRLEKERFDLILMDIQMPEIDGYEATKIIRNRLKLSVPIIGLSAQTNKTKIKQCLSVGMNAFIIKPFDIETLINTINQQLTPALLPPQTIKPNVAPTFSMDKIRYLTNNNRDQISTLIDTFLENTSKNAQLIHEAFERNDLETVYKTAHRIKPAIETLDIVPLNSIIKLLEQNAQKNINNEQTKFYVDEIVRIMSEVCRDLKKIKNHI